MLADIDTRALVRHLRDHGVMRGVISTLETDAEKLVAKARSIPKMDGTDLAKVVSTKSTYVWETGERSHRAGRSGRREGRAGRASTSSPTTSESSRTFCASCGAKAAKSRWSRRRLRRKMCWR